MEQMHIAHSEALYDRAKELMPGGVNSPVRAFQSVGGTPRTSTSTMRTATSISIISAPGDR